jgi:hypothetical protein
MWHTTYAGKWIFTQYALAQATKVLSIFTKRWIDHLQIVLARKSDQVRKQAQAIAQLSDLASDNDHGIEWLA